MKRNLKRIVCFLLALGLLSSALPALADNTEILQLRFRDFWSGETTEVEAVLTKDGYYIYPEALAPVFGMSCTTEGGKLVFQGKFFRAKVNLDSLSAVKVQDLRFCRLEQLLNSLAVAAFVRDGELIYSSPYKNLQLLYTDASEILGASYCKANFLEDSPLLETGAKVLANAYDLLSNLRFSALWGGAYKQDMTGLIVSLLQPLDRESGDYETVIKTAKKLFKWTGNATKLLYGVDSEVDNVYYAIKAAVNMENELADNLLFGIEGTEKLYELLRVRNALNESLVLNDYLKVRLRVKNNFSALTGKEAFTEKDVSLGSSFYSIGDYLKALEYSIHIVNVGREYADALDAVLRYTDKGIVDAEDLFPVSLRHSAKDVLDEYYRVYEGDFLGTLGNQIWNITETGINNIGEEFFKKGIYGGGSLWISLEKLGMEALFHSSGTTDAVRHMFLYEHLQEFFAACLREAMGSCAPGDALVCRAAAVLYLKAALNSYEAFSDDDLGGLAINTDILREKITEHLVNLASYPDGMFLVLQTGTIAPGSLRNLLDDLSDNSAENGIYAANIVDEAGRKRVQYIDSSGYDAVYEYDYSYHVPKIFCDGYAAEAINDRILELYEQYENSRDSSVYLGEVDWECCTEDGILLLRVNYHPYEIDSAYDELIFSEAYYFDTESKTQLSVEEMLDRLGFDAWDILYAVQRELDRRPCTKIFSLEELPDFWYDGENFSFRWHFENGSAHGYYDIVRLTPEGAGDAPGVAAGGSYAPRPVNRPLEYSMLNGSYDDVYASKNDLYTDDMGNLWMSFTINDHFTYPEFPAELAWNAIIEDCYGPILCGDSTQNVYSYEDPREFFDRFPTLDTVHMRLTIEGGLITYIQFILP